MINPKGTAAIANTPNNLLGNTRNKLNVGKKYHSGKKNIQLLLLIKKLIIIIEYFLFFYIYNYLNN